MLEKKNKKRSFTLLELILALAIYSVIVIVLISGFNLSLKVYKKIRVSEVFKLQDFLDEFSSDFRSSYIFTKESSLRFVASLDSLKFIKVASLNDNFRKKGTCELKVVEYYLVKEKDNLWSLYRKERPFLSLGRKKEKKNKILSSLVSMRFFYFDGEAWKTTWDSSKELPQAVKVIIKLKVEDNIETLSTIIDRMII